MHPLERIVRFRRLEEQQARRELERATQLLRAATAARERQSAMVAEQRASLAESWMQASSGSPGQRESAGMQTGRDSPPTSSANPASPDRSELGLPEGGARGWLIAEAALEFSGWTRAQLEQICVAEAKRIEPLVERYVECRRTLRQTEKLIEQRAELARVERERRTQSEADEWFLQRNLRRNRHE